MAEPVVLTLGGQAYELAPGFACLVALEEYFDRPLLEIAGIFIDSEASLKLIVETLAIILAWRSDMRAELGEEIVATGVGWTLEAMQKFFVAALGIGETSGA